MAAIIKFLRGKKTYLLTLVAVVVSGMWAEKVIDDGTYALIMAILGSLGYSTIHAAVSRVEKTNGGSK